MAVVNQWERRVLPQGQLATPREVSISETVGAGMQDIGQAGVRLAGVLARAEAVQRQKDDAALLGKLKPQAIIDMDSRLKALDDPESGSFVDAATDAYDGAVNKTIDDYRDETLKSIQSPTARAEMEAYIGQMKARYVVAAGEFSDERKLAKRYADIGEGNRKWGGVLVTAPGKFGEAVAAQEQAIRAQKLRPEKEAEQIAKMRSFMAGYAMNGEASANPGGFLKSASKWVDLGAEPGDIAQAQGIAESELKRQQAEAKAEAARRQALYQAEVAALADLAISSAENNGGVIPMVNGKPIASGAQLRKAFPGPRGEIMAQNLDLAQKVGQFKSEVQTTTYEEDEARKASLQPKPGGVVTSNQAQLNKFVTDTIDAKRKAMADDLQQTFRDSENEAQQALAAQYDDFAQTAFATGKIADEVKVLIAEAYDGPQAAKFMADLEQQVEFGNMLRKVKSPDTSLAESQAAYAQLQAQADVGGPNSAAAAKEAEALAKALSDKRKALDPETGDPAAFVAHGAIAAKWDHFAKLQEAGDPTAGEVGKAAVDATIEAQVAIGVPPWEALPLPKAWAQTYAGRFSQAQPDQRPQLAQEVMNLGPKALGQIIGAGAPPSLAAYASVDNDPVWIANLVNAEKMAPSDAVNILKARGVTREDLDNAVTEAMADLAPTLPASSLSLYRQSVEAVAIQNLARMPLEDAVTAAAKPFVTSFNVSGSLRIPATYDQDTIEVGLASVKQDILTDAIPVKPIQSFIPGATETDDLMALKEAIRLGGTEWRTNEKGTGAILMLPSGRYLETPDGKRFEIPFSDLEARGNAVPPPAYGGYGSRRPEDPQP